MSTVYDEEYFFFTHVIDGGTGKVIDWYPTDAFFDVERKYHDSEEPGFRKQDFDVGSDILHYREPMAGTFFEPIGYYHEDGEITKALYMDFSLESPEYYIKDFKNNTIKNYGTYSEAGKAICSHRG